MEAAAGYTVHSLDRLIRAELTAPAPPAATALAHRIRERHGDAISAILFYGSCLRKQTHEGVLDFYVIVDSYREAYGPGRLAMINALLPPNVFYLETDTVLAGGQPAERVRCKYAVLSQHDFEALVSPRALHPYIWARFAQPALLVWSRDEATRAQVTQSVAQAVCTCVQRVLPFLPARSGIQRFSFAALWQEAFRRTYRTEFRGESATSIRSLYEAMPLRYEQATCLALDRLEETGQIEAFATVATAAEVHSSPARRLAGRLRWRLTWPWARTLALLRLFKTATTFGDWVPYALWKLERHSGVRPELSERQRRHPLVFAWPVIFRLLRERALR